MDLSQRHKISVILVALAILVGTFLYALYSKPDLIQDLTRKQTNSPIACGLDKCHGLDVKCTTNPVEVCDASYVAGDGCHQYINCQAVGLSCQTQTDSRFDACKSCVEKCQQQYESNPNLFLECENTCVRLGY